MTKYYVYNIDNHRYITRVFKRVDNVWWGYTGSYWWILTTAYGWYKDPDEMAKYMIPVNEQMLDQLEKRFPALAMEYRKVLFYMDVLDAK